MSEPDKLKPVEGGKVGGRKSVAESKTISLAVAVIEQGVATVPVIVVDDRIGHAVCALAIVDTSAKTIASGTVEKLVDRSIQTKVN